MGGGFFFKAKDKKAHYALLLKPKESIEASYFMEIEYENPTEKTIVKVSQKLHNLGVLFDISTSRIVRSIGPNWYQVVLDIHVLKLPDSF